MFFEEAYITGLWLPSGTCAQLFAMCLLKSFKELRSDLTMLFFRLHYLQHPHNCSGMDSLKCASAVSCAAHEPNFSSAEIVQISTSILAVAARGILLAVQHRAQSVVFTGSECCHSAAVGESPQTGLQVKS